MEDSKWTEYVQVGVRGFLFCTLLNLVLALCLVIINSGLFNKKKKKSVSNEYAELKELADYGITLPPSMQGLTEEQVMELKLKDEWEDKCVPSQGPVLNKDDIGRRNGHGKTCSL